LGFKYIKNKKGCDFMQFLVVGYDGTDLEAGNRRLAVRDKHLELANKMRIEGKLLYAAAMLDENEKMIGSTLIMDFASREDLDKWLEAEPYVTGKVWENIEVQPCKVPGMFIKNI